MHRSQAEVTHGSARGHAHHTGVEHRSGRNQTTEGKTEVGPKSNLAQTEVRRKPNRGETEVRPRTRGKAEGTLRSPMKALSKLHNMAYA